MYQGSNKIYLNKFRKDLRNNPSMGEDLLWGFIRKNRLGAKFRRQHSIDNYILDFYSPGLKFNIEIDGEQHDGSIENDLARDKYLNSSGIVVYRVSSLECLRNVEGTIYEIQERIRGLKETTPWPPPLEKAGGYEL